MATMVSIVDQTKQFAVFKKDKLLRSFQAFTAIHIVMGLLRLPQIKDYWATSVVLATPWFSI